MQRIIACFASKAFKGIIAQFIRPRASPTVAAHHFLISYQKQNKPKYNSISLYKVFQMNSIIRILFAVTGKFVYYKIINVTIFQQNTSLSLPGCLCESI